MVLGKQQALLNRQLCKSNVTCHLCFREGYRQERVKLAEKVERLENELALMKVTLQKEMEYKENMEKSHHSLLTEQRDLQTQSVPVTHSAAESFVSQNSTN